MIKNILKLSIAAVLLLGATAVGMDGSSDRVPDLSADDRGMPKASSSVPPSLRAPHMVLAVDPFDLLAAVMMSGDVSGLFRRGGGVSSAMFAATKTGCEGCSACFPKRLASLDAELAALNEKQEKTNASISRLTSELETLDEDADTTSLIANRKQLEDQRAETQAAIDAIPARRTALEEARRLYLEKEERERVAAQARAEEKARREAEAVAQVERLKQLFLTQVTRAPESIEFEVESVASTHANMALVSRLLQEGKFTELRITRATLSSVTLAPLETAGVPSTGIAGAGALDSDEEADDTATGVSAAKVDAAGDDHSGQ